MTRLKELIDDGKLNKIILIHFLAGNIYLLVFLLVKTGMFPFLLLDALILDLTWKFV